MTQASQVELQGKFMIIQGKATELGKSIRDLSKDINEPTMFYFAGQAMTKLEECMHRVHDMFTRLEQLSPENIEAMKAEAIAKGEVVEFPGGAK